MNEELKAWLAELQAAQAAGDTAQVQAAQEEIAKLQAAGARAEAAEQTPSSGKAFVEGAVGTVKAPFQAAGDVMKADLGELPGMAAGMAQGVITGIPDLLRRALGPGAEETRDPAMFMGKGGMRATMPPSVSGPERAGALGTLSVAAATPPAFRGLQRASPTLQTVGAGLGSEAMGALEALERAVAPRRAFYRTAERARRTGKGASGPMQALEEAAITGVVPEEALIAKRLGIPLEQVKGRTGGTPSAPARGRVLPELTPEEAAAIKARHATSQAQTPPAAAPAGEPLPTFGNLAVKPGSVVEEVVSDIQRRGPVAASEILKRGAGVNPATQPPNALLEMLNEAGGNPFAPTAAEAGQQSALVAMRQAAQEAARGAYNLVLEATGNPEAAKAAARRAAGMIQGAYERGTGGL